MVVFMCVCVFTSIFVIVFIGVGPLLGLRVIIVFTFYANKML